MTIKKNKRIWMEIFLIVALIFCALNFSNTIKSLFFLGTMLLLWISLNPKLKWAKKEKMPILILCVIFFVILFQKISNNSFISLSSTLCIFSIIYLPILLDFLFKSNFDNYEFFYKIIIYTSLLFSIYALFTQISSGYYDSRESALGYVSKNFISAMSYLIMPLSLYNIVTRGLKQSFLPICSIVVSGLLVLVSSSRTAFGIIILILVSLGILFAKDLKKMIIFSIIVVITAIVLNRLVITNEQIGLLFERGMTFYNTFGTDSRSILLETSIAKFNGFSIYEKLFGCGTNQIYCFNLWTQPHNIFLEVLLAFGIVGLVAYVVSLIWLLMKYLRGTKKIQKFFIIQMSCIWLVTTCLHPFFSTNYTVVFLVSVTIFIIGRDKYEINKKN